MTRIRSHGWASWLASALILCLMLTMLGPRWGSRAAAQAQAATRILVFPAIDGTADQSGAEAARLVTQQFSRVTREGGAGEVQVFRTGMPQVRRGVDEGNIGAMDVEAVDKGQVDEEIAVVLGAALDAQTVVLLRIQGVVYSDTPPSCEINLQGQAYDVKANYDPQTRGLVAALKVQTFLATGRSPERPGLQPSQRELLRDAARDAATRAASVLTDIKPPPPKAKHPQLGKWLIVGLAALAILFATTGGGGHDQDRNVANELIPTARTMRSDAGFIRLAWVAPITTAHTVFQYQIRRSENGGTAIRVDENLLGPDATVFTDNTITVGRAYFYQIRVLYTDGTTSPWVEFNQTTSN